MDTVRTFIMFKTPYLLMGLVSTEIEYSRIGTRKE